MSATHVLVRVSRLLRPRLRPDGLGAPQPAPAGQPAGVRGRLACVAAAVCLAVSAPAHAFLAGQPGGSGKGAYTNQGGSPGVQNGKTEQQYINDWKRSLGLQSKKQWTGPFKSTGRTPTGVGSSYGTTDPATGRNPRDEQAD